MKRLFMLSALVVLSFGCLANGVGYSAQPASGSVTVAPVVVQNESLDFKLTNNTGYPIKALYIGPTGTGDWDKEDEVLGGRKFNQGDTLDIVFHPKATAEKWDIMVAWADGSGNVEWLGLNLTKIDKVTLVYDKNSGKTTAVID
ncbi:MAG: hypothetical protein K1Y36_20050 [Blastocatellia bacterium]|nr:hypothetical protein [Blastocatellia bacterium]